MKSRFLTFILVLLFPMLLCALATQFPPVSDRLGWRLAELEARVKYALDPPGQEVFVPASQIAPGVLRPTHTLAPTPTPPPSPTPAGPTATPRATSTPVPPPTPIPASFQLSGFRHEYQRWNNCGPATLAMGLSYWGWQGSQKDIAPVVKPNERDVNVMPYEMANFVQEQAGLRAVVRSGGDLDLLKELIAAGFPVIIEKGFEGRNFNGWMGHYELLTAYDEARGEFTAQDSFLGPDVEIAYDTVNAYWRGFNYTFLVIYPAEREDEVKALLGVYWDQASSDERAAERAKAEIDTLQGRDLFFAWFNRGTSLVAVRNYAGAAAAFDQAFSLYASLSEAERPWRMLWYQTGPYFAYYYTGRYQDVIDLATQTLEAASEPVQTESYYWRALAREALGDEEGAVQDLQDALETHPDFPLALEELARLEPGP